MPEGYEYQPAVAGGDFGRAVEILRARVPNPVRPCGVPAAEPSVVRAVGEALDAAGVPVQPYEIDVEAYRSYRRQAGYESLYPGYYPSNLTEKSFEHFAVHSLLQFSPADRFLDVASEGSPLPDIVARTAGAQSYAQDIMYERGVQGRRIGGDACEMPVPDAFVTKAALTCSLEHFESSADTRLFRELSRVIAQGGAVCVVPLYLFTEAAIQTDPRYSAACDVPFDSEAAIFCAKDWGNRHGRFYSADSLARRILAPFSGVFRFTVYRIANPEVLPGVYARWILLAVRL